MDNVRSIKKFLPPGVSFFLLMPYRFYIASLGILKQYRNVPAWLWNSRELTNFTYEYSCLNAMAAIETISVVSRTSRIALNGYFSELASDISLKKHVYDTSRTNEFRFTDKHVKYGRRLLFYLLTRSLKPKIVVEAGVDKGLGACTIGAALQKNSDEGSKGHYIGLDVDPDKGFLFRRPYDAHGEIIHGDSIEYLKSTSHTIDLFFHETSSDPDHTKRQLEALEPRLSATSVVSSCWYTKEFLDFAIRTNRHCLVFRESPVNHWYPGSEIPFAFY